MIVVICDFIYLGFSERVFWIMYMEKGVEDGDMIRTEATAYMRCQRVDTSSIIHLICLEVVNVHD